MPVLREIVKTKQEKALQIAGQTVMVSYDVAKFILSRANNGFVLGAVVGTLMSGYAPMSQGWWAFMGHGVVKNWKWLWGSRSWMDTFSDIGIHAADVGHMATKFGLEEIGLKALAGLIRNVVGELRRKPESTDQSKYMPIVANLMKEIDAINQPSSESDAPRRRTRQERENDLQRRYRAFMASFDTLPPELRNHYFKKVFEDGMRKKMKQRNQRPALEDRRVAPVFGMNQVMSIGDRDVEGEISRSVAKARRRKLQISRGNLADTSDVGEGKKATPLVNYGSGLRQTRRGGATTIKAMAPIVEYNDVGDDPYVMRPKVQ